MLLKEGGLGPVTGARGPTATAAGALSRAAWRCAVRLVSSDSRCTAAVIDVERVHVFSASLYSIAALRPLPQRSATSVAGSGEISLRSPRKMSIFIIKNIYF